MPLTPTEKELLIAKVRKILAGIDDQQTTSPEGWWETSTGADLGKQKLEEVESAIRSS